MIGSPFLKDVLDVLKIGVTQLHSSRHPQVSRAFGSTSRHTNDVKTQNLFSAIAYRSWPRLGKFLGFLGDPGFWGISDGDGILWRPMIGFWCDIEYIGYQKDDCNF